MSDPAPTGVPLLRRGRHRDAQQGSCVMEYVSVLAGKRFSDRPSCTAPVLARLAQRINDALSDDGRPELALRAPRLASASGPDPTALVLEVLGQRGIDLGSNDRSCRRARRLAIGRRASWRYPGARLRLVEAFLALTQELTGTPAPQRDRILIGLLDTVLDRLHQTRNAVSAPQVGATR